MRRLQLNPDIKDKELIRIAAVVNEDLLLHRLTYLDREYGGNYFPEEVIFKGVVCLGNDSPKYLHFLEGHVKAILMNLHGQHLVDKANILVEGKRHTMARHRYNGDYEEPKRLTGYRITPKA